MELFNRDDYLTEEATQKEEFKKARNKFTKKNKEMTDQIKEKVIDPENVEYDKVHVEIYKGVGLGKGWKVGKSKKPEEINIASKGFGYVTTALEKEEETPEFLAYRLVRWVSSLFKKG
ncbi:MAG: hypothetical protein AAF518_16205 [Spirochaetota bacterium]